MAASPEERNLVLPKELKIAQWRVIEKCIMKGQITQGPGNIMEEL